ncbi:hypothetical protein UFOVP67_68 [uncultured Caudovirales phage]|uniref:Uncharacterized protein n=1 Tax=uncultured Caudovirales phage TaxID=2100421 RepID=A0A6J5T923_9CAUD|nr:hypothetical protein UFOVP67_68 [uncultured Caudovirales phage]
MNDDRLEEIANSPAFKDLVEYALGGCTSEVLAYISKGGEVPKDLWDSYNSFVAFLNNYV